MDKIKLTITGCLGRMGRQLIKSSLKSKDFKLELYITTEQRDMFEELLVKELEVFFIYKTKK